MSALPGLSRNAVVAASAGTGKTQLLTSIYLGHAFGLGPHGRRVPATRIVATTFSRAAAAEIRERLETRLTHVLSGAELAGDDPRALGSELSLLVKQHGIGRAELERRARETLDELPYATIDTLHGLAATVLREHAFELGLVPNFTILDEQQAFEDAERVIDDALSRCLAPDATLASGATALLDACSGLENTRGAIIGLLDRLDEEGFDAADLEGGRECSARSHKLAELSELCSRLSGAGPSPFQEPAAVIQGLLQRPDLDLTALGRALGEIAGERATPRLKKLAAWPLVEALFDGLGRASDSRPLRARALLDLLAHAPTLERTTRDVAAVLHEIQKDMRERRRERGALAFSDLLRLARNGLCEHPEIALRAGSKIDLLLVDEFQDTSRVQRDLLLLLRERPERSRDRTPSVMPAANDIQPSGLVVVGDRKQSIYAFRGADVAVFARLAAELAGTEAAQALHLHGVEANPEPVAEFRTLTENFRSGSRILDAVNIIAETDFEAQPTRSFQVRFSDAEALRAPASLVENVAGQLTLIRDDGDTDGLPPLLARAKAPLRAAFVAAGFCAERTRQGLAFGDLAILARRRSTLPLVELALDRLGLPFVVAGRELYATPEVRDVLALLRLALNPRDRHALAVAARGPIGGLSDATLVELCAPGRGLLPASAWNPAAISDRAEAEIAERLAARLTDFTSTAPLISPRDALRFAIRLFEIEEVYSLLPRGQIRLGNIERLSEIAARHGGNLAAFVRWLDRQVLIEADEAEAAVFSEDDDAIRLLTIHASKGLAFPVVVLLDTASPESTSNAPLALLRGDGGPPALVLRHRGPEGPLHTPLLRRYQDDATERARAERQRLSYVALTRARRELVVPLPVAPPKDHTLAHSLVGLLESGRLAPPAVELLDAARLLRVAPQDSPRESEFAAPPPPLPEVVPCRATTLGTTALSDFATCPRRFRLLHLEGLEEPPLYGRAERRLDDDPRSLGSAAHRVLERWPLEEFGTAVEPERIARALAREGLVLDRPETLATATGIARFLASDFAKSARQPGARVLRELGLIVKVAPRVSQRAPQPTRAGKPRQLELFGPKPDLEPDAGSEYLLKATLDLAILREDGSVDVVDYKRSQGGDAHRYLFQLAAYRAAVEFEFSTKRVRTGLVHLLGESGSPEWLEPELPDLAGLMQELVKARFSGAWLALERDACVVARCGFVRACHSPADPTACTEP